MPPKSMKNREKRMSCCMSDPASLAMPLKTRKGRGKRRLEEFNESHSHLAHHNATMDSEYSHLQQTSEVKHDGQNSHIIAMSTLEKNEQAPFPMSKRGRRKRILEELNQPDQQFWHSSAECSSSTAIYNDGKAPPPKTRRGRRKRMLQELNQPAHQLKHCLTEGFSSTATLEIHDERTCK